MATSKTEMPPLSAAEAGGGAGGGVDNGNPDAVVSSGPQSNGSCGGGGGGGGGIGESNGANNTISAAADSSDNQPGTPQPNGNGQMMSNNSNEQQQQQHQLHLAQNSYGMYGTVVTTTNGAVSLPPMFGAGGGGGGGGGGGIYATAGGQADMQSQPYPSYMNSFEQFYQQQQQQHQQQQIANGMDFGLMYAAGGNTTSSGGSYKSASALSNSGSHVRYQPYLNATTTPTNPTTTDGSDNRNVTPEQHNASNGGGNVLGSLQSLAQSNAAVSTTTNSLSPRMVSSSSPTSTSTHHQQSAAGSTTGSPNSAGGKLVCKKCGFQGTNDNELQEHITNVHGASPYGSSGYASSPYIKEELSSGSQQQSGGTQQGQGGNPGEILDLDSQKMVYPPAPGSIQSLLQQPQQMHDALGASDPLHSMHTMQQRALPGWEQPPQPSNVGMQEGLPPYMQQQTQPAQLQAADLNGKPPHANQSPYYSPKQSPYQVPGGMQNGVNSGGISIKEEFGLLKTEYPDSQNYVDKSFGSTVVGDMCHQQQPQLMPVSSSPAEFPSTTTGPQETQQPYRGFEPPTSSSVNTGALPTKAASWKSNEARRPKTYNCTACNKWFTSSGHLKRHYNTTLHKNAVKSSGQPDPATLPISVHHHPTRDPTAGTKSHSRRNNANAAAAAAAAAQKQAAAAAAAAAVQPAELPRSPSDFGQPTAMGMSQYSASPSPTHQAQMNGLASYGANPNVYQPAQQQQAQYMNSIQTASNRNSPSHMSASSNSPTSNNNQTVLNGHPNGLAGPSAQIALTPMPSSHTRGLLSKTITITTKSEPEMEDNYPHNTTSSNSSNSSSSNFNNNNSTILLETEMDTEMPGWELVPLETGVRMQLNMEISQQQQQQQLEEEAAATAAVAAEQAQEAEGQLERHRRVQAELERVERIATFQHHQLVAGLSLEEQQQRSRNNNSSTPMVSPQLLSPPITCHRQPYQVPQQQQQQQQQLPPADNLFSLMQPPAAIHMQQQQQQANIMDHRYNIIPLAINTPPPHNTNMQLLPPPLHTITNSNNNTIPTTVNMDNIHMLHNHMQPTEHHHHHHHTEDQQQQQHHHHRRTLHIQQPTAQAQQERLVLPSMHSMLRNNISIQSPVDHMHNTITPPQLLPLNTTTTTTITQLPQQQQQQQQPPLHTTNTIQLYPQLLEESQLVPLEPTMTYHTIIGSGRGGSDEESLDHTVHTISSDDCSENGEIVLANLESEYDTAAAAAASGRLQTQRLVTIDGQILELVSAPGMAQQLYAVSPRAMSYIPRSPHAGDLPPAYTLMTHGQSMAHEHLQIYGATQQAYEHGPYSAIEEYAAPEPLMSSEASAQVTAGVVSSSSSSSTNTNTNTTTSSSTDSTADDTNKQRNTPTPQVVPKKRRRAKATMKNAENSVLETQQVGDEPNEDPNQETFASTVAPMTTTTETATKRKRSPVKPKGKTTTRRKRVPPNVCTTAPPIEILPNGRLKCLECERDFTKKCYLTQHFNSFHAGEYKFRCDTCGKRFVHEDPYVKHIGRHDMLNKRWTCQICTSVFHFKTDWQRHIMAKHTGQMTHTCPVCMKGFCRNDHLTKHIETHSRPRRSRAQKRGNGKNANETIKEKVQEQELEELEKLNEEPRIPPELVTQKRGRVLVTKKLVKRALGQEVVTRELVTQELETQEIKIEAEEIVPQQLVTEQVYKEQLRQLQQEVVIV